MANEINRRRPGAKTPKKRQWAATALFTVFAVIVAAVAVVGVGIWAFDSFYSPVLDTGTPFDTAGSGDTTVSGDTSDTTASEGDSYTRNKDIVNFLIVGQDLESWKSDVMMLVNFNMKEGSLSILQIPRDTFVSSDFMRGKINNLMYKKSLNAYDTKASPTVKDRIASGMSGAAEFFEERLCIQIDGYALINLEGFRNVIDIIGGVHINVPYDMKYEDPDQDLYIDLKAGEQVLDGKKAEMFVRFRSGLVQGDIGRGDAQKIFLTALFKELKEGINIATLPELIGEAFDHVSTDLSLADIIFYVKELTKVDMAKVSMITLPGEAPNTAHYVMHRSDVLNVVNEYFNVFDTPITDEIFDKNREFTDIEEAKYTAIYNSSAPEVVIYTAAGIDSEGIYIPTIPQH